MRKFKDTLSFIIDGQIWGSHLADHPDERKADLRSHLLAIQITEKVLLILTRHFVFLDYESNQGEHGGSRN
jgi:hypothetical protein